MEPDTIVLDGYMGGPTELDKTAEAFISDLSKQLKDESLDAELATLETSATSDPAVGDAPATGGEKAPDVKAAPEGTKAPEDRGLERLVEREVALRTREQELVSREARIAELESRLKASEERGLPPELQGQFETDAEAALIALKQDPEMVVRQIIAKRMAEKNGGQMDPALRQTMEQAKITKKLRDLEAQLVERDRAAAARDFVARVEAAGREYVNKGIGEHAPTVATVAKANPERVYREIMQEISVDAREKAQGSGGDILTYDEAARRVEARWSEFKTIFAPGAPPASPPASTTTSTTPAPEVKPPTPASTKTPDRPIAPWLRNAATEDEGIRAGLAEFKRVENQR